jgi:hypothetical protein
MLTIHSNATSNTVAIEFGHAALDTTLVESLQLSAASLKSAFVGMVGITLGESIEGILALVAGVGGREGGESEDEWRAEVHLDKESKGTLEVKTVLRNGICRGASWC